MGSWHEDARVFLCIGAWFQDSWSAQFIDLRQQDCYFLLSEVKAKASWSLPSSVESDFPFDSGLDWLRAIHRSIRAPVQASPFSGPMVNHPDLGSSRIPQLLPLRWKESTASVLCVRISLEAIVLPTVLSDS
ncbi:hypothetical protein V6N12_041118 [Hibiscus sabdariffa]|uniref:Uncharacterized protein n=1 Tax=Hibiscus sabdariffa TaxID=183260 RepID=A0ABR2E5N8_9ROSI